MEAILVLNQPSRHIKKIILKVKNKAVLTSSKTIPIVIEAGTKTTTAVEASTKETIRIEEEWREAVAASTIIREEEANTWVEAVRITKIRDKGTTRIITRIRITSVLTKR